MVQKLSDLKTKALFGACIRVGSGDDASHTVNVPITYEQGYPGVPLDVDGNSLHDVVPLQSNQEHKDGTAIVDIDQVATDTIDLSITPGDDPTNHNHRIDLDRGDHNYKVKTQALLFHQKT